MPTGGLENRNEKVDRINGINKIKTPGFLL